MAAVAVINDDGSQTLSAWLEKSDRSSGPWFRTGALGMDAVSAGACWGPETVDVGGSQWWRVIGYMSGAGGSTRVSAWRMEDSKP